MGIVRGSQIGLPSDGPGRSGHVGHWSPACRSSGQTRLLTRFIIAAVLFTCSLVVFYGGDLLPANSSLPAFMKTISPWRTLCKVQPTSRHYAFRSNPRTPALAFPSWGTYEPIATLNPGDPAWPYGEADHVPSLENADDYEPVDVFVGIFSVAEEAGRRDLIRRTYDQQLRYSGLRQVEYRFILGQPSRAQEQDIKAENDVYGDIVVVPIEENMNKGKTYTFFTWAANEATVPACFHRREGGRRTADCHGRTAPQYVIKADSDSFVMLPELERRLRVLPRERLYWGRMISGNNGLKVKGDFMAGLAYGLSMDLVRYISQSDFAWKYRNGVEDQRVGDWMRAHPESNKTVWVSEDCWIYDHPKAAQPWTHGFLYPDTVRAIQEGKDDHLVPDWVPTDQLSEWSTTSPKYRKYTSIPADLTTEQEAESLAEGSPLSLLHSHNLERPLDKAELDRRIKPAFAARKSIEQKMEGWEKGSTVVVHAVKKDEWWENTKADLMGMYV